MKRKSQYTSIVRALAGELGGRWMHKHPPGKWVCDDRLRYIQRVSLLDGTIKLALYYTDRNEPAAFINLKDLNLKKSIKV